MDDMVSELEACTGVRLSPGYDASLGAMFHLRQPLKVTYRCVGVRCKVAIARVK